MKKIILLTAVTLLLGGVEANAQVKDKAVSGKVNLAETNPMLKYYGKTLLVSRHTKADQAVNHDASDYVIFKSDNTADVRFGQDLVILNWTYNNTTKQITATVASNNQQTIWTVQRSELDNLVLFNEADKEMLSLKPKQ